MADEGAIKITVLWTEELRAAAVALDQISGPCGNQEQEMNQIINAIAACETALRGVAEAKCLVLCEGRPASFVPRVTESVSKKTK